MKSLRFGLRLANCLKAFHHGSFRVTQVGWNVDISFWLKETSRGSLLIRMIQKGKNFNQIPFTENLCET